MASACVADVRARAAQPAWPSCAPWRALGRRRAALRASGVVLAALPRSLPQVLTSRALAGGHANSKPVIMVQMLTSGRTGDTHDVC